MNKNIHITILIAVSLIILFLFYIRGMNLIIMTLIIYSGILFTQCITSNKVKCLDDIQDNSVFFIKILMTSPDEHDYCMWFNMWDSEANRYSELKRIILSKDEYIFFKKISKKCKRVSFCSESSIDLEEELSYIKPI